MIWNPFHHRHEPDPVERELDKIERTDEKIEHDLDLLVDAALKLPISFAIQQIANLTSSGEINMSTTPLPQILGITLGNVGTFNTIVTAPTGAAFPSGTTFSWVSSDPLTTLTPSPDTTTVAVATTTSDTSPNFTLTCTSSFTPPGASAPLSTSVTVPLNPTTVTPPPPLTPTAFAINQVS